MKLYGYSKLNESDLQELREVTFSADANVLRELSRFFSEAADSNLASSDVDHLHFRDRVKADLSADFPDIVILKTEA